jgi:O-antigen biosynthesis protein WbqV
VIPSLETIDWHSFLARPALPAPSLETISSLVRQPILITGAGGSIGSALAQRLASHGAQTILLESSENNLYDLQFDLANPEPSSRTTFYLGSVSDRILLDEIFSLHRPHVVFHAAAYKHVPIIEEHPLAAIANNIFGTQCLCDASSVHRARVILLSTDKAVAPASMMGATKCVAEQIVLTSGGTVLRLGNILASRGSVAEVFARQIAAGLPLTVTDPAARRYFLTVAEAVDLLLSASAEEPPTLLVPQLPAPLYIADLARFMAHSLAPTLDVSIEFTHPRDGDKEFEQLWSENETPHPANASGLLQLDSPSIASRQLQIMLATLRESVRRRDLSASLDVLRALAPDYTPSSTVLDMRSPAVPQVSND